jgi:hypothetical protein
VELVTLKNGSTEPKPAISATALAAKYLMKSDPIAFYELVEICRNPNHTPFENTAEKLQSMALLGSNKLPHATVRNVIVSAVEGEKLAMVWTNPVAGQS